MKSHWKLWAGMLGAFVLLAGAGCQPPSKTGSSVNPQSDDSASETSDSRDAATDSSDVTQGDAMQKNAGVTGIIITKAEAAGNGTLEVAFAVEDKLAEKAESYRLLLSKDGEPTWPTEGYWYELGKAHTEKTWTKLPVGERHLRVCAVVNDECEAYSEVMTVEVK